MAAMCEEEVDFRAEAKSIMEDISFAVERITLSKHLDNSKDCVYVNITTLEGKTMCVQLNTSGLKVVGDDVDVCSNQVDPKTYESIYSLLDSVSPGYIKKFGEKLAGKLSNLPQ